MRHRLAWWTLAALLPLAGCAEPPQEPGELVKYCPHWLEGPGSRTGSFNLAAPGAQNATTPNQAEDLLVPEALRHRGQPFDLVRLRIQSLTGKVALRAFNESGSGLEMRDHQVEGTVPVLRLDPSAVGKEYDIHLTPILEDAPATPGQVRLTWTAESGTSSGSYTVTYHYKVCGAIGPRPGN